MFDVQSPPAHPLNSQPLPKVRDRPTWPETEDRGRRCPHEGWRNDRQEGYAEQLNAGVILCVAVAERAQSIRHSIELDLDLPEAGARCIDRFYKRNRCL